MNLVIIWPLTEKVHTVLPGTISPFDDVQGMAEPIEKDYFW